MKSIVKAWATCLACTWLLGCAAQPPRPRPSTPQVERQDGPISAVAPPPPWMLEGGGISDCYANGNVTEVDPDPSSETILQSAMPTSFVHDFGPIAFAPWGADLTRFVVADRARGVRTFDASDAASAPLLSEGTPIPTRPIDLRVAGDNALLVLAGERGGYELWWLGLSRAAPALIARMPQRGRLLAVHSLPEATKVPRLALLVDDRDEAACSEHKRTLVRVLALYPDRIELQQELDLGDGALRILRSGDWLAVESRLPSEREHGVRFIDLRAPALAATARRALRSPLWSFHAGPRTLHVVTMDTESRGTPEQEALFGLYALDQLRVAADGTVAATSSCALEIAAAPPERPGYAPDLARLTNVLYTKQRALLTFVSEEAVTSDVHAIDLRSCKTERLTLPGTFFVLHPDQRLLVSLSPKEARTLDVFVHDLAKLGTPSASAHLELQRPGVRADSIAATGNHYWTPSARWLSVGRKSLLAVRYFQYASSGAFTQGSQLFDVEGGAIVARAPVDLVLIAHADGAVLYLDDAGLHRDQLAADPGVTASGRRFQHELWPHHIGAKLLDDARAPGVASGLARIRFPHPAHAYDPQTDELLAQLELVPGDRDPQTGAAVTSFPISGNAQLHSVRSLLISAAQFVPRAEEGIERPCRFEVYDTRSLAQAKRLAAWDEKTLCDSNHALDSQPALSTPQALVFARTEQRTTPLEILDSRLAFYALDLRAPDKPQWRGPFLTPEGEYALRAFGDGTRVLYGFRVAAKADKPEQPVARYFVRYVDFADPSAPRFGEPIPFPGELIAVHDQRLYGREATWRGDKAEYVVRELGFELGFGQRALLVRSQGIDERSLYNRDREGLAADDEPVDSAQNERLVIRQGTLRREPRSAAWQP